MAFPHELLRSGFPYQLTLGQRRVTTNPMDIGFGKKRIYVLTRSGLGNGVRVIDWEDEPTEFLVRVYSAGLQVC